MKKEKRLKRAKAKAKRNREFRSEYKEALARVKKDRKKRGK